MRKKIVSNLFYHTLDLGFMSLIGYTFYISMGKLLQVEEYGTMMFILSLFFILNPLSILGFGEALPNLIPNVLVKAPNAIRSYVKVALKYSFVTTIALTLAIFGLSFLFPQFSFQFWLLSLLVLSGAAMLFTRSLMQGFQDFKKMFFADFVGHFSRIAFALIFVIGGLSVSGAIMAWVLCFLIITAALYPLILKMLPKGTAKVDTRKLLSFALSSSVFSAGYWFLISIGNITLGFLNDTRSVAFFGVAMIFGVMVLFFSNALAPVLLPTISTLNAKNQKKKIDSIVKMSIKYSILLSALPVLLIASFPQEIIHIFYKQDYLAASSIFVQVLAGAMLFSVSNIILTVLYGIGKAFLRIKLMLFAVFSSLVLTVALSIYSGLQGAAYAFLSSQLIFFFISLYYLKKNINVGIRYRVYLIMLATLLIYLVGNAFLRPLGFVPHFIAILASYVILFLLSLEKRDSILFDTLPQVFFVRFLKWFIRG